MKDKIFKLSDIEAGYLLRVKFPKEDRDFYATVIPVRDSEVSPIVRMFLPDYLTYGEGELALCSNEGDYSALNHFDDDLVGQANGWRIDAVYGRTHPKYLLDCSTEGRELLWEREDVAEDEDDEDPTQPVKMTLAEICDALGHNVEIVD